MIVSSLLLLTGKPSRDPDYVSSIFSFKKRDTTAEKNKQARSKRLQRRREMKLKERSKPKHTCATKATNQLENSNDNLDTPLNETKEPQDHHSEEPQIISFHQPII